AADPGRVQQIAWNLLSNGVKFTPRGGSVRLSATRSGAEIVIRVADTGQGIAPEFLPHVFEAFRQADASTTRSHGGLGLGLAIVKQLVVAHGGTIAAESDGEGEGATFTVRLPAHTGPAALPGRPRRESMPRIVESSSVRLDNLRILVVDDEEDARLLVREVLAAEGAHVEMAASAEEAFDRMRLFRPDVVVSDIGMPKVDGYAFLRRLRALPPERGGRTPAIALTAYARAEDRDRARDAGFQIHIAKPVDPLELVARVADLGGSREARAAI
ncbi:MAG: response regulator, partial [Myxococcales bacterium]|nr:response regulator [Myxococcales bacterium]